PATRALWALHQSRAARAVANLRAGGPKPDMPRHDPFALRAGFVVAAIAALFVAGPEWRERVGAAFDWRAPPSPAPSFRVDGWIDPPLYTRLPPLIVTMSGAGPGGQAEQRLRAPVNSTLIVRIAGRGEATLTPNAALEPVRKEGKDEAGARKAPPSGVPSKTAQSDLREERFRLVGGIAELGIRTEGSERRRLVIESIPDTAPEVERVGNLDINGRGTFNLSYRAKDDYGIASAEGILEPLKAGRSLVPVPKLNLALPADATGATETKTLVDLTDNPWSGARVRLTLVVKDEAGQEGRTAPAEIVLPARPFIQPLARALAEERRRLVTAPDDDRRRVQIALDALMIAPDRFTPQPGIFLGLKTASDRLRLAKSDEDLTAVADLLWEMALKIEDGDLSDAEKSLRAAQDRLKEAMERGAPDEEVKKLTDDLKKALDRFMKEFAERQKQDPKNGQQQQSEQPQGKQKTVTPDQLQKMIQDMQEAMKRGDTAEAQRLLEQLRGILENLQSAENGQKPNQQKSQMDKQMQELDQMSRDQQKLRDKTFKESQDQQGKPRQGQQQKGQQGQKQPGQKGQQQQGQKGQQGQQGQGQQGQGQQGQGEEQGEGEPGGQQQALRKRLEELQNRMKEQGLQGEQGLSDAEEAMKEAEDALGRGQGDQAVDAQGRALDGLKKGSEGMQQQMQQQAEAEGQGQGQQDGENPGQQGQAGSADDDPLGRPTKGRDLSNGNVRVPTADESAVQRTRRIMEELRRKLGDPTRPQEELDYFERLLRRN
ncbi:TIGR02302 family protein, partial [Methylobacterium sp. WL9]